ncbi:MAG: hypothetical protein OXI24_14800 [Candidatus Poribacteria bacterium]|nr:hypothetical protein [Candidatus Poribacteria bacterium]
MKNTFRSVDVLSRLSLFTVLGLAIFLSNCADYSHTQKYIFKSEIESEISNIQFHELTEFNWSTPPNEKKYTGIQNAHELMQAFNADYNYAHLKTEVSIHLKTAGIKTANYDSTFTEREIDARYPREEWLQHLLDGGVTIETFGDYSHYLSKRHTLALLEDNPNLRQLGILDIPPIEDWGTYEAAYMDKLVNHRIEIQGTREQSHRSENGPFSASVTITETFHTR